MLLFVRLQFTANRVMPNGEPAAKKVSREIHTTGKRNSERGMGRAGRLTYGGMSRNGMGCRWSVSHCTVLSYSDILIVQGTANLIVR